MENRLLEYASANTEKLQQLQKKMSENLFRPQISARSRSLAKGKKESGTSKVANGSVSNLDFWRIEAKDA